MLKARSTGDDGAVRPPMNRPRIAPIPEDEWDEEQREAMAIARPPMSERQGDMFRRDSEGPPPGATDFYPILVRHPRLFRRWAQFAGSLLLRSSFTPRQRELVILRVAFLCRGRIEWPEHVRIAHHVGLDADEVNRVVTGPEAPEWQEPDAALLTAVDELHHGAAISQGLWEQLALFLDDRQMIELPMLVAQYHLVAWLQNSLGLGVEDDLLAR